MDEQIAASPLVRAAEALGWEVAEGSRPGTVAIQFPNGRSKRVVSYTLADCKAMANLDISQFVFLGDYDAVVNRGTGVIEARITSLEQDKVLLSPRMLSSLPGVEYVLPRGNEEAAPSRAEGAGSNGAEEARVWRINVVRDEASVELSVISRELLVLLYGAGRDYLADRTISIKLSGAKSSTHDESLKLIERVGGAFLMDLELRYGVGVGLARRLVPRQRDHRIRSTTPPAFPSNEYAAEALELYLYGRSAAGLPLLEYLAYYQALEYFFPMFSREESFRQLRTTLTDPGFDPRSDRALGRLLSLMSPSVRGAGGEREQLRSTVRGCVDASYLRDFVESSERLTEHFCGKRQVIAGVQPLRLGEAQPDIRDQIADRAYAIRCRIVHTKGDGAEAGVELLLPSSREARSLGPDVAVMRFLAQRVLLARATPLRF